jgi:alpha-tubulin suppressor-like RCC1 family protein
LVASNAPPMSNIVDLELGNDNTPCALLSTGNVVCWGSAGGWWADFNGHTGRGYLGNGVPVASIPDDVDTNPAFQFIPPSYVIDSTGVAGSKLSGVKKLSASDYNICALKQNGEVYCWGLNSYGVIGNSGYDMDTVRDVSVPTKVLLPEPVVQVRVLQHHACALTATNKVYCWGGNSCGELGYDPAQVALGITDYPLVRWGGPWRLNTPVPGGAL